MHETNILIVDDTPQNLKILTWILKERGYKVRPAVNGQVALHILEQTLPDLILLDIVMPGMDGYELCQYLKAREITRDIPVLFISALDETTDKVKAFEIGGVDYIRKPFQSEEVLARVETHLALRNMQRQLQMQNEHLRHEITERKKVETALREAQQEIIRLEKDALETRMAGGFAHEMRNALTGAMWMLKSVTDGESTLCQKNADILGELYELLEDVVPATHRKKVLEGFEQLDQHEEMLDKTLRKINRASSRALNVTSLILEYSRVGHADTGDEIVEVRDVIEQVIQEHREAFQEQNVFMYSELSETQKLLGKPAHVYMMINNLLLNARDALLEVKDERDRRIDVTLGLKDQRIMITVRDNANGIEADAIEKIFEPFFSTKPTTGTGLGLSFVSKLVRMYHGTITVDTEVDKGTTFILTIPVNT